MKKEKFTVYDMAKKAGVSIATISRAVNPATRSRVATKTLERIDRLVEKYQYTPNLAARNLSQTSFNTIGVVLPHFSGLFLTHFYSQILAGVADTLLETSLRFKTILLQPRKTKWDRYPFQFAEGVDGLVVPQWPQFFSNKNIIGKLRIPCVVIGEASTKLNAYSVSCDHTRGGELAAEYLYSCGHRKMAVLAGPKGSSDLGLRLKGFKEGLRKKGIKLDPGCLIHANFEEYPAAKEVERLIQQKPNLTAIFCLNDALALGAIKKLRQLGVSCPQKISVAGFDDDAASALSDPPLTTIRQPIYEMAREAARILIENLKQKKSPKNRFQHAVFPVALITRNSVKKIQ